MHFITFFLLLLGSKATFGVETPRQERGPVPIGEYLDIHLSSYDQYSDVSPVIAVVDDYVIKRYTLSHVNASYISVHFSSLNLHPSCKVTTSNSDGGQEDTLKGRGRNNFDSFWSRHVTGDTIIISVMCNEQNKNAQFLIDKYVAGFPDGDTMSGENDDRKRNLRGDVSLPFGNRSLAICNKDDKRNAHCYEDSFPAEYGKAKAVARLLIAGVGACTGFLVGPNNLLLTNSHCIADLDAALNTEIQFMYETIGGSCDRAGVHEAVTTEVVYYAKELVATSYWKDYSLIQLDGNPVGIYGYLDLDDRVPDVGDTIYIPQHAAYRDKELAIYDTFTGGRCRVESTSATSCYLDSSYDDIAYSCDTEGGSSGAPVISIVDGEHKVVALHHCGGECKEGNLGVPVAEIYSEIAGLVYADLPSPPTPVPTVSPPISSTLGPCRQFRLEIQTDYYGDETSWDLRDANGNVVHQGSGYLKNSLVEISKCIVPGDYTFRIKDVYGDGICCEYGAGYYKVWYDGVLVKESDGKFGQKEIVDIVSGNNNGGSCATGNGWTDNSGATCQWYETNEPAGCPTWSHYGGPDGQTAGQACCHCQCTTGAGWKDDAGFECSWYEEHEAKGCPIWGWYPGQGITAGQACCHCRS